jgi:acyl transferase domain-containing protein
MLLLTIVTADELMRDKNDTRVGETSMTMPMTVALQLCLIDLLKSWEITPSAVTSHSSGEFAAAYSVGALTFKEALGLIYYRAEMAHQHQKQSSMAGGMLAAGVGVEEASCYVADRTRGDVVVACINSPNSVTLSGDLPAIEAIESQLKSDGHFVRRLRLPLAFLSHHMLSMAQEYRGFLPSFLTSKHQWDTDVIFTSAVTGNVVTRDTPNVEHWVNNITDPVRFVEAFESMCFSCGADGAPSISNVDVVLEIGPHSTLAGPIRQILAGRKMTYGSILKRSVDAVETAQTLVCELLACGYPVNLKAVNMPFGQEPQGFVSDLPSYPWNHESRYWVETRISKEMRNKKFPHELLGSVIAGSTGPATTWRSFLRRFDLEWLVDHQVDSEVILPGAAYVSMAVEASRLLANSASSVRGFHLRTVNIINTLIVPESSKEVEVHTALRPCNEYELDHRGWYEFEVSSMDASGSWMRNCDGYIFPEMDGVNKSSLSHVSDTPQEESFFPANVTVQDIDISSTYAIMRKMNIRHGPAFQQLLRGRTSGDKSIASFSITNEASASSKYVLYPTILDTIIQSAFISLQKGDSDGCMFLPRSIGNMFIPLELSMQPGTELKAFIEVRKTDRRGIASDIDVPSGHSGEFSTSSFHMKDLFFQSIPQGRTPVLTIMMYLLMERHNGNWIRRIEFQQSSKTQ